MSERRDDTTRARDAVGSGGWRDFVSSALLVGAVVAILIAGLMLKAERRVEPAAASQPPPPASLPLGSTIAPEPVPPEAAVPAATAPPEPETQAPQAPTPVADPLLESLASRAAADSGRLRGAKGAWTAQLLVACRKETVDRAVASSGRSAKLYVLPAEMRGDACFRVCWGVYASAKDAAAAADLPKALRGKEKIAAVEIAKVLP